MNTILLFLVVFLLPEKEYTVVDIKNNQLNYYIILLKENKTDQYYCFETRATETNLNNSEKVKIGDIVTLKLRRYKKTAKFKVNKKIDTFDDLNMYDDSLKVNKNYYCKELNGLYLARTPLP